MPAPRWLARLNRFTTNRTLGRLAPFLPFFGVVTHHGRRSGREYRTPVNVFRSPHGYAIALVYGRESDWVRNVLAEGGCTLLTRGRTIRLTYPHVLLLSPRLMHEERHRPIPRPVSVILRLLGVADFLQLDTP